MPFVLENQVKNSIIFCLTKIISSFYENLESCLDNAIKRALDEKKTVNIVFSPACASFDQFKNFEERGKAFKKLTNKLIKKCFR